MITNTPDCINILGKKLPVTKRGSGNIPLLILGPADFFLTNPDLLPEEMDAIFTIYFVDIFSSIKNPNIDYSKLTIADFIECVETIRNKLNLNKIAIFAHSALGFLALEYSRKYNEFTMLNLLIACPPLWGQKKQQAVDYFFEENASECRKAFYAADQADFKQYSDNENLPKFVSSYVARGTLFFYDFVERNNLIKMWGNAILDEPLIAQYFSLLGGIDINQDKFPQMPTFLALGLYDYSNPHYLWTDEKSAILKLENVEYYIFPDGAHYPMKEQKNDFLNKFFDFMKEKKILSNQNTGLFI